MITELNIESGDLKESFIKLAESKGWGESEVREVRKKWMDATHEASDLGLRPLAEVAEFVVHELCLVEQYFDSKEFARARAENS